MADEVPQIIDQQIAYANNYISQAQGFINQVANLANQEFPVSLPASLGFGLTDVTADALDKINNLRPVRPATFGAITALSPDAPLINFAEIDSSLVEQVRVKIAFDLENGGYGIEPADEEALWQRERDRETIGAQAEVEEVTRQFAESGFSLPPGAMLNAIARVQQNMQNKLSSVGRDIGLRRSELYFQARKNAIETAMSVENILVSLHRALTDQAQVTTAIFNSQINKYQTDTQAGIDVIKSNLGIYMADVQAFTAAIGAIGEAYRLKSQETGMNNSWNVEVVRTQLAAAKLRLDGMVSSAHVRINASEFGASYYGKIIAAALSSIVALATVSKTDA